MTCTTYSTLHPHDSSCAICLRRRLGNESRKCNDPAEDISPCDQASWLPGTMKSGLTTERRSMHFNSGLRPISFLLLVITVCAQAQTPAKHAMTFDDLMSVERVGEPQISPDGRAVVYTVGTTDMDTNRVAHNIWVVSTAPGSPPRQLTESGHDTRPQWSPDGKTIAFLSSREGASQVYVMAAQGGNAKKITSLSTGADNEKWSPDGRSIAFTSSVYPDC